MDKAAIKALLGKSDKEIIAQIPAMDREALVEVLAQESEAAQPRESVTKAAAAQIEVLDHDEDSEPAPAPAPAAKGKSDPKTDFTHPGYSGPLTIDQAEWRARNIKPAKVPAKK